MISKVSLIFVVASFFVLNTNAGGPIQDCPSVDGLFMVFLDSLKSTLTFYEIKSQNALDEYAASHTSQDKNEFDLGIQGVLNDNINEMANEYTNLIQSFAETLKIDPTSAIYYFVIGIDADYPLSCVDKNIVSKLYLDAYNVINAYYDNIVANHK
ncbi:hypothetical protein PVAND_015357 [Polypedilum vanderplanki]|uniref:Uncharacterized protein n=1 Tax=Polypedilum vanderplanki TaxID=319348 RepID=A0A9J6BCJ9_POLVA|nr:hypothetical protein PVAND_015357 [Polypedilum vanderplanki]